MLNPVHRILSFFGRSAPGAGAEEHQTSTSHTIVVQVNARLLPMDRSEHFGDPLDEQLMNAGCGEVSGGGAMLSPAGEVEYCELEVQVDGDLAEAEQLVVDTLTRLGAPKGSRLLIKDQNREVDFGDAEGLAVYLNGTDLPPEVYQTSDSSFVYIEIQRLLGESGRVLSHWQGPTETAFYLYGPSYREMRQLIANFLASYPLCAKARVEQIA